MMYVKRLWTLLSSSDAVVYLVLAVVLATYSCIHLQDFHLRLSNHHLSDDTPIFYAYASKFPERFDNDYLGPYLVRIWRPAAVAASIQNWVPTLLYTQFDIEPFPVTKCFSLLHGLGLGLGVFLLVRVVSENKIVALLATCFAYLAYPWGLNLANYGFDSEWTFMPYAANGAIGATLIGIALALTGRYWIWSYLFLLYAGLLHPMIGLYASTAIGLYFLWQFFAHKASIWRVVFLGFVTVIILAPGMIATSTMAGTPLAKSELFTGMRLNQHHWPWCFNFRWQYAWPAVIQWNVLAFLSWKRRVHFSDKYCHLWICTLVAVAFLSVSQVLGMLLEIPLLVGTTGLRSISLLSLVSLPLVLGYLLDNLQSGHPLRMLMASFFFILPFLGGEYILIGYLTIAFCVLDLGEGDFGAFHFSSSPAAKNACNLLSGMVILLWVTSFLRITNDSSSAASLLTRIHSNLTWNAMQSNPDVTSRAIVLITATSLCALLICSHWRSRGATSAILLNGARSTPLLWIISLLYCSFFLVNARAESDTIHKSRVPDMLDVQLWARDHSAVDALFLTPFRCSWTSSSKRRFFYPISFEDYAYRGVEEFKEHRDRLLAFYNIPEHIAIRHRGQTLKRIEKRKFDDLDETGLRRFAQEFGVTHFVTWKSPRALSFKLPILYENDSLVVFDLAQRIPETTSQHGKIGREPFGGLSTIEPPEESGLP
jgi:hypothetical protein